MATCTQSMQRTWWLVSSTTIVTGSYSNLFLPWRSSLQVWKSSSKILWRGSWADDILGLFTHWNLMTHLCVSEKSHHCFRQWSQAISGSSDNALSIEPIGTSFNETRRPIFFSNKYALQCVIYKISTLLPECVNSLVPVGCVNNFNDKP